MYQGRKYWLLAVSYWLLAISIGKAQDTLSFATVDAESYALYTSENWDELITYGNLAISKGIDYYYLRIRIGTAYYKRQNYRKAEVQFEKANAFNTTDEASEYLYFCYIFLGQYDRARWFIKSLSSEAAAYCGTNNLKSISFATLEGGIGTTDSTQQFNSYYYMQGGLGLYVQNRLSLFQAVTYFTQQTFRSNVSQIQYYLNPSIPLKHGWSLSMGIQPILESTALKSYTYTKDSSVDGIRFDTVRSKIHPRMDSIIQQHPTFSRPTVTQTESTGSTQTKLHIVGAITLTKSFLNFDLSIGSAIGTFDTATQYEHYMGLTWYPFGNTKLFFGATGYIHTENHYSTIHTALVPFITANPFHPLTLTVSYLANNGGNLIENTGYIVSGTPDPTLSRLSIIANFALTNSFSIYGVYQNLDNIETHQHWPFQYNLFVIGIKFIPK